MEMKTRCINLRALVAQEELSFYQTVLLCLSHTHPIYFHIFCKIHLCVVKANKHSLFLTKALHILILSGSDKQLN